MTDTALKTKLAGLLVGEDKILKWWSIRKPTKRGRWKASRFTEGQKVNMLKYYEARGPFMTKGEAEH